MIDIRYGTENDALSNLYPREFTIDGVKCASMEGFLQSLKYQDIQKQQYCCTLFGHKARQYGRQAPDWRDTQTLYWKGVAIDRHSDAYELLLDRAYSIMFSTESGKVALLATGDEKLTHSVGHSDPNETILTTREFCSRLTDIRKFLQAKQFLEF